VAGNISATNATLTGYLRGPSSFVIDPAAHGDDTGTVIIAGNLQVDGTTTTINSTTVTVDDKNLVLASGSINAAAADGAGITIDCGTGTDATFTYDGTNDEWDFNKNVKISGSVGVTNIVTNKVVKFNGTILDDSNITDTGSLITLGTSTDISGPLQFTSNVAFSLTEPGRIYKASNHGLAFHGVTGTENDFALFTPNGQLMVVNPTGTNTVSLVPAVPSGKVGIGTTTPQDLLHLSASSPVLRLTNTNDTGKSSIEFWDNQSGTSQAGEIFYNDSSNLFGLQGNANGIVFAANNTFPGAELMRLTSSGNLGIGTASPAGKFHVVGAANDQTAAIDSSALPDTTLFATMVLDGSYTDGKYRTRFSKIDRGGGLPLYVQESLGTANSFVNIARFGSHANSVHKFEVFGSFKGTYFETANNAIIRKNVDGWSYTPHDILYNGWNNSTGDYTYLKAAGNSNGPHGIIVASDNGFYIGSDNLELGGLADSATSPITNTWAYVNSTGLKVNGVVDVNSTFAMKGEEATLATTTQTQIAAFSATAYGGGKFVITAKDGVNRHICELLVTHDGTTAVATQYGSVTTASDLATYDVDISGGNVRILATSASTNSTVYKVAETLMEA
jgi:hypothetical protein